VSVDFFTVPTIRFQILLVFLVLAHGRRRIVHFAVTAHPTAEWTAQQMREVFPWESAPRYLLRDRDRIFGRDFVNQVEAMGIKQVLSAPRSPCSQQANHAGLASHVPRLASIAAPLKWLRTRGYSRMTLTMVDSSHCAIH
jgi:hypothetical protein